MSVATLPTELKQSPVIVSWVLVIGERTRYYRPAPIERLKVESETPHQLRIEGRGKGQVKGHNVWQDKAYCIPSDKEWFEVLRRHDRFEEALDELGTYLLELGSYAKKLAAAGGIKKAPNPLTPTVISCKDPETDEGSWGANLPWEVYPPHVYRRKALAHTPKMLRYWMEGEHWSGESITSQADQFLCPDDAAWEQFQALRQAAIAASNHLQDYLKQLGTYQEAKQDGRYNHNGRANPDRIDEPAPAETAIAGGATPADEPPASNAGNGATGSTGPEESGEGERQSISPVKPTELKTGDRVELYRSESGEELPESQRRRAKVTQVFGKSWLRVHYRGETFAGGKEQSDCFRKLPDRDPLPYPTQPVQIASRGETVVVTAPDHPCYGETFTVHAISIFGAFRADNTFFYDEELGYRVDVDDPYIQPIPTERDETLTCTLEPGDMVLVLADDDLYEAIVTVYRNLPSFEIEIDYQGLLLAYPRHNLKLYERATPESLAYLKLQHSTTPTQPTLHQRWETLRAEIEQIKQSGPVAPAGAEWKRYRKIKTIGKGDRAQKVTYPADGGYYYTIWHREAIFTNASGKLVKSLQVGTNDSALYNDWQQRFERRRAIKQLQKTVDAIERQSL